MKEITDTERLDLIQSMIDNYKHEQFHIEQLNANANCPFKLKCFSIRTQHFYGDNIRDIIDMIITGEYVNRTYYGVEWVKRDWR